MSARINREAQQTKAAGYISTFDDTIPHIAFGGTWTTKITVINFRMATVTVPIYFASDNGDPLSLPIGGKTYDSISVTLAPLAKYTFETDYLPQSAASSGMGRLTIPCDTADSCGNVGGFAVFKWHIEGKPDQEAVVPFTSSTQSRAFISFDELSGYFTGVALTHPWFISTAAVDITVVARDQLGNRLMMDQIRLNADGHTSFLIRDKWPQLKGQQGTIEFTTSDYVAPLALVFNPTGALTTSPCFMVD
jgi:hypothetical protein